MAKKPAKTKTKTRGKGKTIVIAAVAVVVLLGGGGAAAYFTGMLDSVLGIADAEIIPEVPSQELELATPVYYDLPEFVADLKINDDFRPPFLKLQLTVQVAEQDLASVIEREPKIIDRVQRLLRDQTRLDLTGAEGSERLRADIVIIMNQTLDPAVVHNVLFKQMILQ